LAKEVILHLMKAITLYKLDGY